LRRSPIGVRWSSHHFGQFIDPIVKVRDILVKLLKRGDHLGDFSRTQDRRLQIEQLAALGKAMPLADHATT